ncbi:MAG: DUF1684 domain-containing protein [Inquilinus sp.]|nr:DUF1684 domain-containing protein [Inquilinus sp.]
MADGQEAGAGGSAADWLALADWRRRMAEIYAHLRATADSKAAWRQWRAERDRLFAEHRHSPIPPEARRRFAGLPFFDYNPALRFEIALTEPADRSAFTVELGADGTLHLQPVARTEGLAPALGGELTIYWLAGYGGGLFLPFADATSGAETYGGGRYLLDAIKGADLGRAGDRPIVDFNFAYNPSCAYSPAWTCPLAPPENRLPNPVRAGEKAP